MNPGYLKAARKEQAHAVCLLLSPSHCVQPDSPINGTNRQGERSRHGRGHPICGSLAGPANLVADRQNDDAAFTKLLP